MTFARRDLPNFLTAFTKAAADAFESESMRAYTPRDTARRLPSARTGLGQGRQAYTAPVPAVSATNDASATARAVPPPPV